MDITLDDVPVFAPVSQSRWRPHPIARGPFDGMQGGAAAALMCAGVEALAAAEGLGFAASFTAHFLKPVALDELIVDCAPLRVGRRVSVVDARLSTSDGICAVARATLVAGVFDEAIPEPPPARVDPTTFDPIVRAAPHGGLWFMDAMEVRADGEGRHWFRLKRPIVGGQGPMTMTLPAADWAHGLGPPLGAVAKPLAAIPNPDLSVHLIRPPVGDWIGLSPASGWSKAGVGAGWAALFDTEGRIGQVAMSVAVTLLNR